eukprot:Opistho-1_new@25072
MSENARKPYALFESAVTPGSSRPSRSSRLAPPPVLTWLTLSSVLYLAAHVAVSPPPMIVVHPRAVAATTASMSAFVPASNFSNSKTPAGPFHTMSLARSTASLKIALLFGPQSRPRRPAGMPVSSVA